MINQDQQFFLNFHKIAHSKTILSKHQLCISLSLFMCSLNLSGKRKILQFLEEDMPKCLRTLDVQEAYLKMRVKLFNERKKIRQQIQINLKKISH